MLRRIFIVSLLFLGLNADDFTCPKDPITMNDGVSGSIPKGATSMVKFEVNANCTFRFEIQKGFAIKMETSAVYDISPGDFVMFDHFYVLSGADKQVDWAVGPEVNVSFFSVTGNLTFFAQYTYVDLTGYTQVLKKTGEYFNTTMEAGKYYTAQAATGDTVTYNLAMRNTGFYDHTIDEIFMFDGPDIVNSEYIGRITDYFHTFNFQSDSDTLTFLNLYGSPSNSYILTNDFSKIYNLPQYSVEVVDPTAETTGFMYNVLNQADSYYTFICDGCTHFYIEDLSFGKDGNVSGYLEVRGMSPTQDLPYILNYTNSPFVNMSLPQLIPSPMATFHAYRSTVEFYIKADLQNDFLAVGNEKKRTVYSPKLWNPDADQQFDYTFSDPTKVYNFSINLESVRLQEDGDELDVQVGSVNGLSTLDKKYTKTSLSNVPLSGMGRYLHVKYSGSKDSEVILSFEEIDPDSPPATVGTTASPGTGSTVKSASTSSTGPSSVSSTVPTSTSVSTSTASVQTSTSTAPSSTSAQTSTVVSTSTQVSTSPSRSTMSSTVTPTTAAGKTTTKILPTSTTTETSTTSTSSPSATRLATFSTKGMPSTSSFPSFSPPPTTSITSSPPLTSTTQLLPSTKFSTHSTAPVTIPSSTTAPSETVQMISTIPSTTPPTPSSSPVENAASVSTSTVHTTTSTGSSLTGFFVLVTLCITLL